MKRLMLMMIILCFALIGCGNTEKDMTFEESEQLIEEANEILRKENMIDGFENASLEYSRFNSLASENGLDGTKIYVLGKVSESISKGDVIGIILEQEDGEKWVVVIGNKPLYGEEKTQELIGKEVKIFGEYMGFSSALEMPSLHFISALGNYYLLVDEEKITSDAFISLDGLLEASEKIIYSECKNEKNKGTYKISEGIIKSVEKISSYWVDFIQKEENVFSVQTVQIDSKDALFDIEELEKFSYGDGIKLYYSITETGNVVFVAAEKIDPEFTMDDYANNYKEKCNEYSYTDIARNPDKVKGEYAKLAGEVIQVLESGKSVTLRVNMTKGKYGYYSDTVYVTYTRKSDDEDRILEDDIVEIYGELDGLETYTAVLGQEVSLPKIYAEYITIQ